MDLLSKVTLAVPAFHVYGHRAACQVVYQSYILLHVYISLIFNNVQESCTLSTQGFTLTACYNTNVLGHF